MPPAASARASSSTARRRRPRLRPTEGSVGVQGVVQLNGLSGAGEGLDGAGGGVAAEQQVGHAGEFGGLDDLGGVFAYLVLGPGDAYAGACRDVEAGFDNGVVADADTDA